VAVVRPHAARGRFRGCRPRLDEPFDANAVKTSVGGELSADVIFGFFVPLTTPSALRGDTTAAAWRPIARRSISASDERF
jgi:hypothetical protein